MRRAAIVLLGWGLWLAALTALQLPFRSVKGPYGVHWIEAAMLGGAAAACTLVGLALWALDARRRGAPGAWLLTSESPATVALATGLCLTLIGAGFGLWLILIGAGVSALGAGGLAREAVVRRRVRAAIGPARGRAPAPGSAEGGARR